LRCNDLEKDQTNDVLRKYLQQKFTALGIASVDQDTQALEVF